MSKRAWLIPVTIGAVIIMSSCSTAQPDGSAKGSSASPTTTAQASSSMTSSQRVATINAAIFGTMDGVLWRSVDTVGESSVFNDDRSVRPGSYVLQTLCDGGSVTVSANGQSTQLPCSGALGPGMRICLTSTGLHAELRRSAGPPAQVGWQLKRRPATDCARDPA